MLRQSEWCVQLHAAVRRGKLSVVKSLTSAPYTRRDVDAPEHSGGSGTALMTACLRRQLDIVLHLLSRGANPNHVDHTGWSPMAIAADRGSVGLASALARAGALIEGPSAQAGSCVSRAQAGSCVSPLSNAAASGRAEMALWLLDRGADLGGVLCAGRDRVARMVWGARHACTLVGLARRHSVDITRMRTGYRVPRGHLARVAMAQRVCHLAPWPGVALGRPGRPHWHHYPRTWRRVVVALACVLRLGRSGLPVLPKPLVHCVVSWLADEDDSHLLEHVRRDMEREAQLEEQRRRATADGDDSLMCVQGELWETHVSDEDDFGDDEVDEDDDDDYDDDDAYDGDPEW